MKVDACFEEEEKSSPLSPPPPPRGMATKWGMLQQVACPILPLQSDLPNYSVWSVLSSQLSCPRAKGEQKTKQISALVGI